MKYLKSFAIVLLTSFVSIAHANESTGAVKIKSITNWVGTENNPKESLHIKTHETSLTNPAECSKTDSYILKATSAISRSMILTAITAKSNVSLTIWGGGCTDSNQPIIVAVSLTE